MNKIVASVLLVLLTFSLTSSINFHIIQAQSSYQGKPSWVNKYNSSLNNPASGVLYSSIKNPEFFSFSYHGINEEASSKAIIFNEVAYIVTKSVSLFMLDLETLEYSSKKLSVSNSNLNSTPALAAGNCNSLAVVDGISNIRFFKINDRFVLSELYSYGPLNTYSHALNVFNNKFYVTKISSPSGQVLVFECNGSLSNVYLLFTYEEPSAGVAVSNNGIFVVTNYGKLSKINSWSAPVGLNFLQEPLIYGSQVIVRGKSGSDSEETLFALDINSGNKLWSYKIGIGIASPLLVYQDKIFFIAKNSTIIALDVYSGSPVLAKKLPSDVTFLNFIADLISIDRILVFTAKYGNTYAVFYYDIVNDLLDYYTLTDDIGKPIGLSLAKGKIVVTAERGIGLLPIKAPSTLIINANPSDQKYSVLINGTAYTISPMSNLKINYLIVFNSSLLIEIQDEIKLDSMRILRIVSWNGVISYDYNKSIVNIYQWNTSNITANFDIYILTKIALGYSVLNSNNINIKPALMINDTKINSYSDFVRQNYYIYIKIYAEQMVIINETTKLVFQKWSDGNSSNLRIVKLNAGDSLSLQALYIITSNYTLILEIKPNDFKREVLKHLRSSLPINDSLIWTVNQNSSHFFNLDSRVIEINSTMGLLFRGYYGEISSNDTTINIIVNKNNYKIILIFEIQNLYSLNLYNITIYNNTIQNITEYNLLNKWSSSPINFTILITKIIYKDFKERYTFLKFNSSEDLKNQIIDEKTLSVNFQLKPGVNKIYLYYTIEKLTELVLITNDKGVKQVAINGTQYYFPDGNATIKLTFWASKPINLEISVPEKIKIDDTKYLVFRSVNDFKNSTLKITLEPGDRLVLNLKYELEEISILPSYLILILIVLLSIIMMAFIFRKRPSFR